MKVLYGTTNPAKIASMKCITKALGLEIIGLNDLKQPLPVVEETGKNPLENTEIKARTYYNTFKILVSLVIVVCILTNWKILYQLI